jgi:hypothetical protein
MLFEFIFEYETRFGVGCWAAGSPQPWKLEVLSLVSLTSGRKLKWKTDSTQILAGNDMVTEKSSITSSAAVSVYQLL